MRVRSLREWAERFVAALDVDRFGVIGWSAGGPHALAVAAVAPERVTRVALVASMPPPDGVADAARRRASGHARRAHRSAARRARARAVGKACRRRRPATRSPTRRTRAAASESFRDGGLWLARELAYLGRPWGFELADVRAPVTLWWGERDAVCPPPIARVYEERLPDATLHLTDDTHQILFTRWRELLADVSRSDTSGV